MGIEATSSDLPSVWKDPSGRMATAEERLESEARNKPRKQECDHNRQTVTGNSVNKLAKVVRELQQRTTVKVKVKLKQML